MSICTKCDRDYYEFNDVGDGMCPSCADAPETVEDDRTVVGYVMTMEGGSGWMYLGENPDEVANSIRGEFQGHEGLPAVEISDYHIKAKKFSRKEIDEMPEFTGW